MPKVSVIIPAYNCAHYVEQAIRSVLAQRWGDLEVWVIDDGSTDGTRDVAESLACHDRRVRIIRLDKNSGRPSIPRNRGIAAARGELVAFLDADDLWTRWKLNDQVAAMIAHPDLALVYSPLWSFGHTNILASQYEYGLIPFPSQAALTRKALERKNPIACSSVLARLDQVRAVCGFDEDPQLKAVEDYDLWLRLSQRGGMGFIPRVHGFYRVHPGGISRDQKATSDRIQYLYEKRHISSSAQAQKYDIARRIARNLAHFSAMVWLRWVEWQTRSSGAAVPVRLCGSLATKSNP
jgi:glycosyltransferase involved in cell wall biosynthesis